MFSTRRPNESDRLTDVDQNNADNQSGQSPYGSIDSQSSPMPSSSLPVGGRSSSLAVRALQYSSNVAVHSVLIGLTAYITYISFYKGIVLFTWHPPLMMLGFFVLMTEAICCFVDTNIPTLGLSAVRRKQLHWILQAIGSCSITVAFVVILLNKNRLHKPHFTTWHGIFGLIAVIAAGISLLGGIVALYSVQWRRYLAIRPAIVRLGHNAFGVLAYGFGIVAIALGIMSNWVAENADFGTQAVCTGLVIAVAVYAVLAPLWHAYERVRQLASRN